jgi:cytochrome c5
VQSAIKGKGAMPPKGGSAASDAEIRAAVEYMVSAAK